MANKSILYIIITIFVWRKTLKEPIWGLAFFSAIFFIRPETISYQQLTFLHIPMVTASITLVSYLFHRNRLDKPIDTDLLVLFLVFYLITIASTARSEVYPIWRWSEAYFKLLAFAFLMTRIIVDRRSLDAFVLAVLIGAGFLSVWGVDQYWRGNYRLEGVGGDRFGSNEFGVILVSTFPLFLYKARGRMSIFSNKMLRRTETVLFIVITVAVVASIIYTFSRGAFVGLCSTIIVIIIKSRSKFKTLLIIATLVPLLSSFLPNNYIDRIKTIFTTKNLEQLENDDVKSEDTAVDGSIKGRTDFWKAAIEMAKDHPGFGVGLQNFELLTAKYTNGRYGTKDTHNTYLKIAAELGITAIIIFLSMVFLSFRNLVIARKYLNRAKAGTLLYYQKGIEAGLVGILVSALFGSYNYCEPLYWLMFLTASLRVLSQQVYMAELSLRLNTQGQAVS